VKERRSYKFKVVKPHMGLNLDYVFADNPEEAVEKALLLLDIEEGTLVEVKRVRDHEHLSLRLQ
jgi:hypothetical protein